MDMETLNRAFEAFYTTKSRGTGLGLSLCYSILTGHGGSIEIDSTEGTGTQVRIFLPLPADGGERYTMTDHYNCSSLTTNRLFAKWCGSFAQVGLYRRTGRRRRNRAWKGFPRGDVDIALCDIKLPGLSGIELLRQARSANIDTAFIMMTAFASVDTAIEAIKAGAADYMIKPLNNDELLHRLNKVGDLRGLRAENRVLRRLVLGVNQEVFGFNSPAMREMEHMAAKVARTSSTVLITGESGTGKGVVARLIHQQSPRAEGPFIPVNCGAIPENLVESEFFGHSRGAFTGADKARKGLFLEADGGTIFLDEIGELPLLAASEAVACDRTKGGAPGRRRTNTPC